MESIDTCTSTFTAYVTFHNICTFSFLARSPTRTQLTKSFKWSPGDLRCRKPTDRHPCFYLFCHGVGVGQLAVTSSPDPRTQGVTPSVFPRDGSFPLCVTFPSVVYSVMFVPLTRCPLSGLTVVSHIDPQSLPKHFCHYKCDSETSYSSSKSSLAYLTRSISLSDTLPGPCVSQVT